MAGRHKSVRLTVALLFHLAVARYNLQQAIHDSRATSHIHDRNRWIIESLTEARNKVKKTK
jgi:hypothetical protein